MPRRKLNTKTPSGLTVPLRLDEFTRWKKKFSADEFTHGHDYYQLPPNVEDDLTALLGSDPLAEYLLISSMTAQAKALWSRWRTKARKSRAFSGEDVLGQVQIAATEAARSFDPERSDSFTKYAIPIIRQHFHKWATVEITKVEQGISVGYDTIDRHRRGVKVSDANKAHLDLPAPTMMSFNASLDPSDPDSMQRGEAVPSDIADPDDVLVDKEAIREAKEIIAGFDLSPEEFTALHLYIGIGSSDPLSLNQCAAEMGFGSRNTVKRLLTSAAKKMGVQLTDLERAHTEAKKAP